MIDSTVAIQELHDLYVWKLSKELRREYDTVSTNIELLGRGRIVGEIDVLVVKDGEVHAYEVKHSHRPTKARKQLLRTKKHVPEVTRYFLYCGEADKLIEITP